MIRNFFIKKKNLLFLNKIRIFSINKILNEEKKENDEKSNNNLEN